MFKCLVLRSRVCGRGLVYFVPTVVSSIFLTYHFSTFYPLFSDSSSFISLVFFFSHLNPQFSCLASLCSFHFTYSHIHIFTYSCFFPEKVFLVPIILHPYNSLIEISLISTSDLSYISLTSLLVFPFPSSQSLSTNSPP